MHKTTNSLFPGLTGTMYVGSDSYAVVVTKVFTDKKCEVAETLNLDLSKVYSEDGLDVVDKDTLISIQEGNDEKTIYTLRKNGRWMPQGKEMYGPCSVKFGYAEKFLDPDF